MTDYDNTNSGVLFKNDKDGNEKRPDYTGEINVDGKDLRLAAWIKTSAKGNKFMSLRVSEKEERRDSQPVSNTDDFDSEEVPF